MILFKLSRLSFTCLAIVLLSACGKRFYTPNSNPLPLFKNRGDVYFNASTNLINKVDGTLGYAVANGFGTYVATARSREKYSYNSYLNGSSFPSTYTNIHNGYLFNFGAGYFLPEKISEQFRFEIFGDLALGNYYNTYAYSAGGASTPTRSYITGDYKRMGVLTNVAYNCCDNFLTIAYTARISNISFSKFSTDNVAVWEDEINKLNSRSSYNLLEHGISFTVGKGRIKYQNQVGFFHGMNSQGEDKSAVQQTNYLFSAGITIKLNTRKK